MFRKKEKRKHCLISSTRPGYGILLLSKTWLIPYVSNGELFLDNFHFYRAERMIGKNCVSKYNGILIGIKGNIPHTGISTETLSESLVEVEADKKNAICSNIQSPRQQSISNFHQ